MTLSGRASRTVLALGALLALTACTSSDSGSSSRGAMNGAVAEVPSSAAGAVGDQAGGSAGGGSAGAASPSGDGATTLSPQRIVTAQLTVAVHRVGQVATQADRADSIAVDAGGQVDSDDRVTGRDAHARLVLGVPPTRLPAVMRGLSGLGMERSQSSTSTGVTERVADVGARLDNSRAEIARLRTLYERATKVSDVLAVESDLSGREADLESLEAQQRALSEQTSMATVTVTLETQAAAPAHHAARYGGFVGALHRGWNAFLGAIRGIGIGLGAVWPFLLIALALAAGARVRLRRRRSCPVSSPLAGS